MLQISDKMRQLRDTQARLRSRIKFFGVEGGDIPVIVSASVSALLITLASQRGSVLLGVLGALPCVLTYGYFKVFVTGRRPHFTRDLVCLILNGRSVSPLPPQKQPQHPYANR